MTATRSSADTATLFSDEGAMTLILSSGAAAQVDSAYTQWLGKTFSLKASDGENAVEGSWHIDWDKHPAKIVSDGTALFPGSPSQAVTAITEAFDGIEWWPGELSPSSENIISRPRLDEETSCKVTLLPLPGEYVWLSEFPGAEDEVTDLLSKGATLDLNLKFGELVDRKSLLGKLDHVDLTDDATSMAQDIATATVTMSKYVPYELETFFNGVRFGVWPGTMVYQSLSVNGKEFAASENPGVLGTVMLPTRIRPGGASS